MDFRKICHVAIKVIFDFRTLIALIACFVFALLAGFISDFGTRVVEAVKISKGAAKKAASEKDGEQSDAAEKDKAPATKKK